jgi:hypothetical protein
MDLEVLVTDGAELRAPPLRKTDPLMLIEADPLSAQSIVRWSEALKGVVGWEGELIR